MVYQEITSEETEAGKPTKQELLTKIRNNDIDFDSRLTTVEAAILSQGPIVFEINGPYALGGSPQTQVLLHRVQADITLLNARIFVIEAGTAGTLEVDLEYSVDDGDNWDTIFTTRPSVVYSAGDYFLSTNQVLAVTDLSAGNLLRLNITAVQTGGGNFQVLVDYESA